MASEADGVAEDGVVVPFRCFRCDTEQQVPFAHWRAGAVIHCDRCRAMLVPTTPMEEAVQRLVAEFRAAHPAPLADGDRAALTERLRQALAGLRVPGAPLPRRGFFRF